MEEEIRRRLGEFIFGADRDTLEGVVVAALHSRRWRLATIEIGSGGVLSTRIQGVLDGPTVYRGGLIAPSIGGSLPPPFDRSELVASVTELAGAVREWFGAEVGVSVVIPPVPKDASVLARVGVATPDTTTEKEFSVGIGVLQVRGRISTLGLDLIRRIVQSF